MYDQKAVVLALNVDTDTGTVVLEPEPARRTDRLFPEPSDATDDNGDLINEILYGIKRGNGGFVGLNINRNNGLPTSVQWFDTSLHKRAATRLLSRVGQTGELIQDNRVLAMRDWQPVADQFFAIGALGIAESLNQFREGFYITQLQTPGNDNVVPMARMVSDLPGLRHYVFHHEFIAIDGDVVYFLEMSTHPNLLFYDTRNDMLGRLEGFPGSDKGIPYPPLDTIDGMYKSVERMEIPVGLYFATGFLYAVLREPEREGSSVTSWKVIKLRPDFNSGTVERVGMVQLPTLRATRHLYILPGETSWLVLELASMPPRIRKHRLLAAMTVPLSWISEPQQSPLRESSAEGSSVVCRTSH